MHYGSVLASNINMSANVVTQEVNKQMTFRLNDVETQLTKSNSQVRQQQDRSVIMCIFSMLAVLWCASSALTLLVGCQEWHPARKNLTDEVLAWLSTGAKCK